MLIRTLTGALAAAAVTLLIFFGPAWSLTLAVLAAAVLSYLEFSRLFFRVRDVYRRVRLLPFICAGIYVLEHAPAWAWVFVWSPFIFLGISVEWRANETGDFQGAVRDLTIEYLAFLYVVSLLGFLTPIAATSPYGRYYLYLLFMIVFGGDTFAYFVGSKWGKHKLAGQLSPKKSIEGAVGAFAGAFFFTAIWVHFLYPGPKDPSFLLRLFLFVPVLSGFAQMGDLFESLLKRSQSQKDSGHFLPGHGGILDRIDSLAFAAPAFYLYLTWIMQKA